MHTNVSRLLDVIFLAASAPCASASDLHVPADYSTIQAAIDASSSGDAVLVDPGTYYENIDFKGKAITVKSTDGPEATTIDGGGKDHVVRFLSSETTAALLEGFTIRDGLASGGGNAGGGIIVDGSSPTISRNVIVANVAVYGGGLALHASAAVIVDNFFWGNLANNDGGGIYCSSRRSDGLSPLITNNTIAGNTAAGGGGGGMTIVSADPFVTNSIVEENVNGEIYVPSGSPVVTYCDVTGGFSGTGNIDADPLFVDLANGDLHLAAGSPCIDTGSASAPVLPVVDVDGDARIIGAGPDIGADEAHPIVDSITPARSRYDRPPNVTLKGSLFTSGSGLSVTFGTSSASNVVVVDDQTITCDVPAGEPGQVDVVVSNSLGAGVLLNGFNYTPSIVLEGDFSPGGSVTAHIYCDLLDGLSSPTDSCPRLRFRRRHSTASCRRSVQLPRLPPQLAVQRAGVERDDSQRSRSLRRRRVATGTGRPKADDPAQGRRLDKLRGALDPVRRDRP